MCRIFEAYSTNDRPERLQLNGGRAAQSYRNKQHLENLFCSETSQRRKLFAMQPITSLLNAVSSTSQAKHRKN